MLCCSHSPIPKRMPIYHSSCQQLLIATVVDLQLLLCSYICSYNHSASDINNRISHKRAEKLEI